MIVTQQVFKIIALDRRTGETFWYQQLRPVYIDIIPRADFSG